MKPSRKTIHPSCAAAFFQRRLSPAKPLLAWMTAMRSDPGDAAPAQCRTRAALPAPARKFILVLPLDQTKNAEIDSLPIEQVTSLIGLAPSSGRRARPRQNGRHMTQPRHGNRRRHQARETRFGIRSDERDRQITRQLDPCRRGRIAVHHPRPPRTAPGLYFRFPAGLPAD